MNKYQEALDYLKSLDTKQINNYLSFIETYEPYDTTLYNADEDVFNKINILQELVDKHKPSKHYTKQQLIDELDKVYTIARQYDDNLIHYADIYRLIERLVEDE